MTKENRINVNRLVVGGLNKDDFEWAAQQHEELGYVLVAFVLDCDGYHWKAVYVKVTSLKNHGRLTYLDPNKEVMLKTLGERGLPSLSVPVFTREVFKP